MGAHQACFTTGCGNPGTYHTGDTRHADGTVVPGVLLCAACWAFRLENNTGNDAYQTGALDGVAGIKAFAGRTSDDQPVAGGAHWSWLPYDTPAGVDEDGRTVYQQHQNPVHCRKARSGSAGRGRGVPRSVRVRVDLEQLASEYLTPDQWAVLYLQLQGASYEEIAEDLGLEIVTVRERLRRARSKLREVQSA